MRIKMALSKFIVLIGIAMLFCNAQCRKNSCKKCYTIKNLSTKAIYFGTQFDSALIRLNYPPGASPAEFKCEVNSEKSECGHEFSCALQGLDSYYPKAYFFIFDANVIETTNWDTIKQNRLLLKRFDLTKAQLDSCNWVITYP